MKRSERTRDKPQYLIMIKCSKLRMEGNFLSLPNGIYKEVYLKYNTNNKIPKAISLISAPEKNDVHSHHFYSTFLFKIKILTSRAKQITEIKMCKDRKGRNIVIFTDGRIVCIGNPKQSTDMLFESVSELSKVNRYKFNMQSTLYLYSLAMKMRKIKYQK